MSMTPADVRVSQVVLSLEPGGTEKLVVDLVTRLSKQIDCRVYCLDGEGGWAAAVRDAGIPVDVVGRRPGFDLHVAARLAKLARAHGRNVLHCHQYSPFVYGRLAALGCRGLSVVYTEHGRLSDAPPSPRRRAANVVLGRLAGPICAVSADLRRFMVSEGFPPDRVVVVHNGIDPGLPPSPELRRRARAELRLPESAFVVGAAARLDPVKNLDFGIRAFATAASGRPDACLVIIGDGPERERLERVAREHGVGDTTRFLGYRPDVRALLPALDVYVNTSIFEGISVTILEAMAAGLPVVATAVGGTTEILTDGVDGYLVAPHDGEAFAGRLRMLADRPVERVAMGAMARARLLRDFTSRRMVDRYLEVYRDLTRPGRYAPAAAPARV